MIVCRQSLIAGWLVLSVALAYAPVYVQDRARRAKVGPGERPNGPANVAAAASSRADLLSDVMPDGWGLRGRGVTVGIWDQAGARATHRDLAGHVVIGDAAGAADHSTHVAATVGGSGASQAAARGLAPEALLLSYDWSLDMVELRERAPQLAVSVHAYGARMGWASNPACSEAPSWLGRADEREDRGFGKYGREARDVDLIAYETGALTVWAAGNERQDVGASGEPHFHFPDCEDSHTDAHVAEVSSGYDTIGLQLASKNALVVGASAHIDEPPASAEEIAVLPFSSFGPMDDGRIKPDVVASGALIFSATAAADDAHASYSGTSSSAAVAGGAIALLTEHYRDLNGGVDLPAEAMRALVLHTAVPASQDRGPTYAAGYGLLDAKAAADLIADDAAQPDGTRQIALGTVADDAVFEVSTGVIQPGQAFRVSIAWTDPPGAINEGGVDDGAAALVNDLDLELIAPDGETTRYPWSLDRAHPAGAATRAGPNRADNAEVADVTPAMVSETGAWRIRVSAHGSLYRKRLQSFALIASVPFDEPLGAVLQAPRSLLLESEVGQRPPEITVPLRIRGSPESIVTSARSDADWLAIESEEPLALRVASESLAQGVHYATLTLEHDALGPHHVGVVLRVRCEPDCTGLACGLDPICGQSCGGCGAGEYCGASHACEGWTPGCPAADLGTSLDPLVALGTTQGASDDAAGSCGGDGADDIAFAWTAPEAGVYRFATDGSALDTVLHVRDGPCDGAELGCNDDAGNTSSALSLSLEAQQHVTVFIDGASSATAGDFHLSIQRAMCPDADIGSSLGRAIAEGSTRGTDVAFAWAAPESATYTFTAIDSGDPHIICIRSVDCSGEVLGCASAPDEDIALDLARGEGVVALLAPFAASKGRFQLGITSSAGLCAGSCDGSPNEGACFCDSACVELGDCCHDACATCGSCCAPACDGRSCGDDGCEGSCGSCDDGERCDLGECVADPCANAKNGASCDDGDACTLQDRCIGGRCGGLPGRCAERDAGTDAGESYAEANENDAEVRPDQGEGGEIFSTSKSSCACSSVGARADAGPSLWLILLAVLGAARLRRIRINMRAAVMALASLIVGGCDSSSTDSNIDEPQGGHGGEAGDGAEMSDIEPVDARMPDSDHDAAVNSEDEDAGTTRLMCGRGECELLDPLSCGDDLGCQLAIDEASQEPRSLCVETGVGLDGDRCEFPEDCSAGLDCTSFDGKGSCRRYCCALNTTAGCPDGQFCRVALEDMSSSTGVALCDRCDQCELADVDSCGDGLGCYPLGEGCTACLPAGAKAIGEECQLADECQPGAACFSVGSELRCVAFCVQGGMACPSEQQCLGDIGLKDDVGICL